MSMMVSATNVVTVHLDDEGNITSLQRAKEPQYISGDYPKWLKERVALVKMADIGKMVDTLKALKITSQYIILYLSKKELTEVGKLLGT
jgi:hypothetical protein